MATKITVLTIFSLLFSLCDSNLTFDVYQHVFSNTFHLPPPISCNHNLTHQHEKLQITLWDIDTTASNLDLLQIQKYEVQSECYLDFFGSEHKSIISKVKKLLTTEELQFATNFFHLLHVNEEKTYHSSTGYICRWLSTTKQTSIQYLLEKTSTYYNPDGTISGLHGYKLYEIDSNYYGVIDSKDLTGYLIPKSLISHSCPPLYGNHYTAIRGINKDYDLITIPEIQFQVMLNRNKQKIYCYYNGVTIYRSEAGYLLSIPEANTSIQQQDSQISKTILNPSYLTGEISYFLTKITRETNTTFQIIEEEICKFRQNLWLTIISRGDLNSLGLYFTGDLWSKVIKHHQDYKVYKRSVADTNCTVPPITQISNKTMLVLCPTIGTVYIHPYSNLLSKDYVINLTIFDYLITLDNGDFWDYQKQINISKLSMNYYPTNAIILSHPSTQFYPQGSSKDRIPEMNTIDQYPNILSFLTSWKTLFMTVFGICCLCTVGCCLILCLPCKKSQSLSMPI